MTLNVYKKTGLCKIVVSFSMRGLSHWLVALLKWWLPLALQGSRACSWLMVMCFIFLYLHTELLLRKCQRKQLAKLWQQELNVNVGIFFLLFPNRPRCCKWPTQKNCPELGLFGSFTLYFSVKQCLAAACESTCVLHLLILKTFNLPLRLTALKITADTFVSASKR